MAEIISLLSSSRFVTLTGPAGVGKTRLALETASANASAYPDGAIFVELADIVDRRSVPQAVASALGLSEQPGRSLVDSASDDLARRRLLLILDNAEHLVEATVEIIGQLLRACPHVAVLVTSQKALDAPGERRLTVSPLQLPGSEGDGLEMSESVMLFCDRAAAVRFGFELDAASISVATEICRRLDGIPLAIELAAALVDAFAPADIAARLDDRFGLLTRGSLGGAPRHQRLETALGWSHNLLSKSEQALFRRLGVFSGGAPADAIAAVCAGGAVEPDRVPEHLAALVSRSLVAVDRRLEPPRYRLLETISLYARERLAETPEAVEQLARHASWYLQLAETTVARLTGPGQRGALHRLDAERDNFNAALSWALTEGKVDLALRISGALALFWRMRCIFSEGRHWLDAALNAAPPTQSRSWALAQWGSGFLALMLGDLVAGVDHVEHALAVFQDHGDIGGCARCFLLLGNFSVFSSPLETAVLRLEESIRGARAVGDCWCLAHALALLGLTYLRHGKVDSARPVLEESVAVATRAGDKQGQHFGMRILGLLALREGAYDESEGLLERALSLTWELGETYGAADAMCLLGEVAMGRGDRERAETLLRDGLALTRETANPPAVQETLCTLGRFYQMSGEPLQARSCLEEALAVRGPSGSVVAGLAEFHQARGELAAAEAGFEEALTLLGGSGDDFLQGRVLHGLGTVARARRDEQQAARRFGQALALRHRVNDAPGVAETMEALAGVALGEQDWRRAARLVGAAQQLRDAGGYARPRIQQPVYSADLAALRSRLEPDEFDAARAEGTSMPLDDAVSDAVATTEAMPQRPPTGWAALSEEERQMACLVAGGLTNKAIAERMFISARTVGGRLTRIFAALGVTSRAQLARAVKRHAEDGANSA